MQDLTYEARTTHHFGVEYQGIIYAMFSECSSLTASIKVDRWEEGGAPFVHKFPARADYDNLTLKRGITTSSELYDWFMEVRDGKWSRKTITVRLFGSDHAQNPVGWHLFDAFPVKWTGPGLNATQTGIAVEAIEFAHHGIQKIG